MDNVLFSSTRKPSTGTKNGPSLIQKVPLRHGDVTFSAVLITCSVSFLCRQRNESRNFLSDEKKSKFLSTGNFLFSGILMFNYYSFHRWYCLFSFFIFELVILLIRRRCHTFSTRLNVKLWNNALEIFKLFLTLEVIVVISKRRGFSCFSSSRYCTCMVCKNWPGSTWELADKRRLYCLRRSTVTKDKNCVQGEELSTQNYLRTLNQWIMRSPPRMALLPGIGSMMAAALRMGESFKVVVVMVPKP